ncbi:hypothetical protein DT304_00485 [Lactobacillus reuteri]|uniref:hypothetical protein n=1 Tax=Bacillota TaxID=1239 RepID=UPI001651BE9B|nr:MULTISPECIES: hypothetical protein [Bacillota]MBC6909812.1 hypothetical protein [Limosilactobacillus reuteri]
MPKVKRNLVQVRLTDDQLKQFDSVKQILHAENNSDAIRQLISDKKLTDGTTQEALTQAVNQYTDLSAKLDSLMWNSSNITNNVNQVAHVLNAAAQADPEDVDTWNWVMQQLQAIATNNNQLRQLVDEVKHWLSEGCVIHGSPNV